MTKRVADDQRIAQLREEIAADLMALRRRSVIHPPCGGSSAGPWSGSDDEACG